MIVLAMTRGFKSSTLSKPPVSTFRFRLRTKPFRSDFNVIDVYLFTVKPVYINYLVVHLDAVSHTGFEVIDPNLQ